MSELNRKGLNTYRDMRDGEWAARHALEIWIGVIVVSLLLSFGIYRTLFGSPDDTDFKKMLAHIGKNVASADEVKVGEVALISNFSYLAYDVKFYRDNGLIANFKEVSISMFPLTALLGDVYTEAELRFRKGGMIQVYAAIPPLQIRNLSTVGFSSIEVKATDMPLQALTGALIPNATKSPVKIMEGVLSGRISFDDKQEIKTKSGFLHLSAKRVKLAVQCNHPAVQWKGCKQRLVDIDPFHLNTKLRKGKMSLVDPMLLRIHLTQETAKISGSALLKYPPAVNLSLSSPSKAKVTPVLRGLFNCKPKRSANYRIRGKLGSLKCR